MGETYAAAGVDIDAGEEAVRRIKDKVRSTFRPEVVGEIGGFGAVFDFGAHGYRHPLLVSSTDGVGTKAVVATEAGHFESIGIDLVAMCVDDLVCMGAEPPFFLDYISVGALDPRQIEDLVEGVVVGCREAGCALIGGEMAEHPGVMEPGDFELVGFAVGVVERDEVLDGSRLQPTDVLIGLPSPGLRSNGYSLARRLLFDVAGRSIDDPAYHGASRTVGEELLLPSVIYTPAVRALLDSDEIDVHGVVHVTGGGMPGNVGRILADDLDAVIDRTLWEPPRIFDELQTIGSVADEEMEKVFNLGVGMIVAVPLADAYRAIDQLRILGHRAMRIGEIHAGSGLARIER